MKLLYSLTLSILATAVAFGQDAAPPKKAETPKQQVNGFYAKCADNRAAEGLSDMLASNPVVQGNDVTRVAQAFGQLVSQMGKYVDYELVKETKVSERTVVIRCVSHFERQPFTNEFTFYDPGKGDWRLVHLKYDANLASMFLDDLADKKGE